eukprot:4469267-Amphidinium_carterae.2
MLLGWIMRSHTCVGLGFAKVLRHTRLARSFLERLGTLIVVLMGSRKGAESRCSAIDELKLLIAVHSCCFSGFLTHSVHHNFANEVLFISLLTTAAIVAVWLLFWPLSNIAGARWKNIESDRARFAHGYPEVRSHQRKMMLRVCQFNAWAPSVS